MVWGGLPASTAPSPRSDSHRPAGLGLLRAPHPQQNKEKSKKLSGITAVFKAVCQGEALRSGLIGPRVPAMSPPAEAGPPLASPPHGQGQRHPGTSCPPPSPTSRDTRGHVLHAAMR